MIDALIFIAVSFAWLVIGFLAGAKVQKKRNKEVNAILKFQNDDFRQANKILANKIERLNRSNAQLNRRPRG